MTASSIRTREALAACCQGLKMLSERALRWLGSHELGVLSLQLASVGAKLGFRNLCEALRKRLDDAAAFKPALLAAYGRILAIPAVKSVSVQPAHIESRQVKPEASCPLKNRWTHGRDHSSLAGPASQVQRGIQGPRLLRPAIVRAARSRRLPGCTTSTTTSYIAGSARPSRQRRRPRSALQSLPALRRTRSVPAQHLLLCRFRCSPLRSVL
jgi:hypothetical protein